MSQRTWRWVSRDSPAGTAEMWSGEQQPRAIVNKYGAVTFMSSDGEQFGRLCEADVRPGECVKIELSEIKEIK